ncbi:TadE/TadG family type IV pilus assembly protein [Sphingomonas adhaesiva]|uniref:TadE/TadG family type IV pilus assembly protein n=1 Tax=Sphingomonas adhaesiva TaxID=28212 RepID=UPI002FF86950
MIRLAPRRRPVAAIARDRRGATIVEFALVLLPFLTMLLGSLDIGYQVYLNALTNGALERAARKAAVGNRTRQQVIDLVTDEVRTILPVAQRSDPNAVIVTPLSYFNFSNVGGGERITGDTAPVGVYNVGDCYEDRNNNGRYDATGGGGADLGSSDDIIYYKVDVSVPRLSPLLAAIGLGNTTDIHAKTLIRNQPYGDQQVRIRCS